jgi:hypothetical protein
LEELKIPWASVISQKRKITFATTQDFIGSKTDLPEKYHILLDEYNNIFFVEDKFFDFVEILKFSQSLIGFSGSPLNSTKRNSLNIVSASRHWYCNLLHSLTWVIKRLSYARPKANL